MERTQEPYKYDLDKIRLERARQGKSITQLAAETNLSAKTLIRIEHNKVVPRPQTIGKIAEALGKDIKDFIIDTNYKLKNSYIWKSTKGAAETSKKVRTRYLLDEERRKKAF